MHDIFEEEIIDNDKRNHLRKSPNLNNILGHVNLLQDWDAVGSRLPRPVLGSGEDVPSWQGDGYAGLLDGAGLLPYLLENGFGSHFGQK